MEAASDPLGLVGTTIAEKYVVEDVVGEGGFAIVYRAMHAVWKRPVAVKVFKALGEVAPAERQKLLDDFIQEGRLLADLSERSPAICQARDVGTLTTPRGDSVPYMVLEWLDGMPLDAVLAAERERQLPLRGIDEAVHLLDAAAGALALAHKKGIAHRDVKPANVFVLGDPRGPDLAVKLLDFGIAKVVQDAQKMGFGKTGGNITSFTPSYGAPEQFNRSYGATGPWTDVFALALVVVETMTGRDPLPGDTLVQLAFASSDPTKRPTPRAFGVTTSDEVEAVLLRALAVSPAERYQTVGEFWSALHLAVTGRSAAMPASDSEPRPLADPSAFAATALVSSAGNTAPGATVGQPAPPSGPVSGGGRTAKGPPAALLALGGLLVLAVMGAAFIFKVAGVKPPPPPASSAAPSATAASSATPPAANGCPEGMKWISGGAFYMGSDAKGAQDFEKPPHPVKLSAYCLDELEVTVAQHLACSNIGGCLRASKNNRWDDITPFEEKTYDPLCNINASEKNADHPANCVDWTQAQKYCQWRGARLPTEAEWEFAARGSEGRIYPWGDDPPNERLLNACGKECAAWMRAQRVPADQIGEMFAGTDGFVHTAPVGSFPSGKSKWGIQDMTGNVSEWVADLYAEYDAESATKESLDPRGPATTASGRRVIRGGAWNSHDPSWVRPSWRYHAAANQQSHGIGFRCAKSL